MSDSKQQYILAKPISRDRGTDDEDFGGYYIYTGESSDAHAFIYPDGFDELFVPLDISAIEKQLEQLLAPFIFMSSQEGYYELEDNELFEKLNSEDDTKVIVAEVLAVFGLENKETSDG